MLVIIILASLAALVVFFLCVPLNMAFHANVYGKPEVQLRVSWLFGLVNKEITGEKKKAEEKKRLARVKKKRRRGDVRVIFSIMRTGGLLSRIKIFLRGVLSCFMFRELAGDFTIGLGDPADTGLLFAFIGPATAFFGYSRFHQLRIVPSFTDDAILEGYSQGKVRLRPISLAPHFVKLAFSLTTIRIAMTLVAGKWKRKK
ncbi:DUF2953 domain-containing protein [Chloroflexota bacterium]